MWCGFPGDGAGRRGRRHPAGAGLEQALVYGTAHDALTMTTPGDVSMASLAEVEALIAGGAAHVRR